VFDTKMSRTALVSIFAIKEIPSMVGSLPAASNCFLATSTYACFRTSLNSGKATAFLTAIRTNGFSKYLKAASRFSLTDCVIHQHITTVLLSEFTLLVNCCVAAVCFAAKSASAKMACQPGMGGSLYECLSLSGPWSIVDGRFNTPIDQNSSVNWRNAIGYPCGKL